MAGQEHHYAVQVKWTGNRGKGTSGYRDYERDYTISTSGKADIAGSSDPAFRGDPSAGTRKTCWSPRSRPATSSGICISAPSTASSLKTISTMPKARW